MAKRVLIGLGCSAFGLYKGSALYLNRLLNNPAVQNNALYQAILNDSAVEVKRFYDAANQYRSTLQRYRAFVGRCSFGQWKKPFPDLPDAVPLFDKELEKEILGLYADGQDPTYIMILSAAVMNKARALEAIVCNSPECVGKKGSCRRDIKREVPEYLSLSAFAHRSEEELKAFRILESAACPYPIPFRSIGCEHTQDCFSFAVFPATGRKLSGELSAIRVCHNILPSHKQKLQSLGYSIGVEGMALRMDYREQLNISVRSQFRSTYMGEKVQTFLLPKMIMNHFGKEHTLDKPMLEFLSTFPTREMDAAHRVAKQFLDTITETTSPNLLPSVCKHNKMN